MNFGIILGTYAENGFREGSVSQIGVRTPAVGAGLVVVTIAASKSFYSRKRNYPESRLAIPFFYKTWQTSRGSVLLSPTVKLALSKFSTSNLSGNSPTFRNSETFYEKTTAKSNRFSDQ